MELKVTEKTENPLLERKKIKFDAEHSNAPTPSRPEVSKELSSALGVPEELIVIEKLATPHGRQTASGIARVYESEDRLEEFEPKHLIKRAEVSEEREVEEKEAEEVEEAEKEAEKIEEEVPEEEEEAPREEIDYQELSKQNISDIKEKAEELDLDYQKLLEVERENKDRKTLKGWLEEKIETSEEG